MNYLWIFTFSFAFVSMLVLSRRIEKQLKEIGEKKNFSYTELGNGEYEIYPCVSNPEYLRHITNVVWLKVEMKQQGKVITLKAETLETVQDIIIVLSSY